VHVHIYHIKSTRGVERIKANQAVEVVEFIETLDELEEAVTEAEASLEVGDTPERRVGVSLGMVSPDVGVWYPSVADDEEDEAPSSLRNIRANLAEGTPGVGTAMGTSEVGTATGTSEVGTLLGIGSSPVSALGALTGGLTGGAGTPDGRPALGIATGGETGRELVGRVTFGGATSV